MWGSTVGSVILIVCAIVLLLMIHAALKRLIYLIFRTDKDGKPRYDWQPDLSQNVKVNEVQSWAGGHQNITLTPKSQEQIHEEKRSYLNERDK